MATLNLIVLRSADIDRAAAFYARLGLEFVRHRHGSGPEHQSATMGDLVFELYSRQGDADSAATRIGFSVESVDAAVAALVEAGGRIVSPAKDSPWGRRAVLDDPDGHRVELTEPPARAYDTTRDVLIQAEDLDSAGVTSFCRPIPER